MKDNTHLRTLLGATDEYVNYCREERNFAAMLYHLLLDEGRLRAFLDLVGHPMADVKDVGIYFEYAHLRDLWAQVQGDIESRNRRYREAIVRMLEPERELPTETRLFNEFFIGEGSRDASDLYIRMPSRWSDKQFDRWCEFGELAFAKRACMIRWAFNAKPDLVLHLAGNTVLCIETKLESPIGDYRANVGGVHGCFRMSQTELQEFILGKLLRYSAHFAIVAKSKQGGRKCTWPRYTWDEVFGALLAAHPPKVGESQMVAEFRNRVRAP